jgi:hypothetical protein
MKFLILSFFLAANAANAANVKIRFLNGIQNTPADMLDSTNALSNAYSLYKTVDMPKLDSTAFASYSNPKDPWIIGDDVELSIQGTISGVAQKYATAEWTLKLAKAKAAGLNISDDTANQWYQTIYQNTLTEYYANYLVGSNSTGKINIKGVISDTLEKIRSDINDGSSVVIVSHSQGNLFAESISSQLTASEKTRVRFVGVASVASTTPNNRYITFKTDLAVFGAYNALRLSIAPLASAPLPYTDIGYYTGPEGIASFWDAISSIFSTSLTACISRAINCPSAMGHSFTDVYLNYSVVNSEQDLTPVASKIIKYIGDSISELVPISATPTITSLSPLTATVGTKQTFTITGTNLPTTDHLDVVANGCNDIAFGATTNTIHTFTCTPTGGDFNVVLSSPPPLVAYTATFKVSVPTERVDNSSGSTGVDVCQIHGGVSGTPPQAQPNLQPTTTISNGAHQSGFVPPGTSTALNVTNGSGGVVQIPSSSTVTEQTSGRGLAHGEGSQTGGTITGGSPPTGVVTNSGCV